MISKLVSPMGFPLFLAAVFWFCERNRSPQHEVERTRMRFYGAICSLVACGEYAEAWHREIGLAWQSYPNVALPSTFAVFAVIMAVAGPLPDFTKKL